MALWTYDLYIGHQSSRGGGKDDDSNGVVFSILNKLRAKAMYILSYTNTPRSMYILKIKGPRNCGPIAYIIYNKPTYTCKYITRDVHKKVILHC